MPRQSFSIDVYDTKKLAVRKNPRAPRSETLERSHAVHSLIATSEFFLLRVRRGDNLKESTHDALTCGSYRSRAVAVDVVSHN